MRRDRLYRIAGISTGALLLFLVFFFFLLELIIPHFVDLTGIKNKLEQSVLDSTGIRADIRKLRINLTVFDGIEVVFDNNVLYDPKDIEVVNAGQVLVNIRYLPLLIQRKTSISRVAFNNIAVTVGEKGFLMNMKKQEAPSKTVVLEDTRIEFNNYRIRIDRFFDGTNQYFLHGHYLSLSHYNASQPLVLQGAGTGYFGKEKADQRLGRLRLLIQADQKIAQSSRVNWRDVHRFRIQLEDVELPTLANIAQTYGFPLEADGRVGQLAFDYRALPGQTRTFAINGNTKTQTRLQLESYRFHFEPGKLAFHTRLDLNPESRRVMLSNLRLDLENPDFNAHLTGNTFLREPFDESRVDLTLTMSPLSLAGLNSLPVIPAAQRKLLDRLEGRFQSRMHVWGTLKNPQAKGTLALRDLALHSARTGAWLMRNVDTTVNILSNEQFQLERLTGTIAGSPVRATATLNTETGRIQGSVNAPRLNLNQLSTLGQLILPESPWFREFSLTGQSGIDLTANGTFSAPGLQGRVTLNRVRLADLKRNETLLTEGTGTIDFRDDRIVIPGIRGRLGPGDMLIAGWLNQDRSNSDLRVQAPRLDLARLERTVQSVARLMGQTIAGFDTIHLGGLASVDAKIQGPLDQPALGGLVRLNKVDVTYLPKRVRLQNLTGPIRLTPQAIRLQNIRGHFRDIPFTLAGSADTTFKRYHIRMNTPEVGILRLTRLVNEFAPQAAGSLRQAGIRSGMARLALAFSPVYPGGLGGMVHIRNLLAVPDMLNTPVQIARLRYDVGQSRLEIPRSTVVVGDLKAQAQGYVAGKNYNLRVAARHVPVSYFRDNRAMLQRLVPTAVLPTLYNTAGSVSVIAHVQPGINRANIRFHNAGASMRELKYPVYNVNGQLAVLTGKRFQANTNHLRLTYANSPVSVSLIMLDMRHIRSSASGSIHPLLSTDLLPQAGRMITGILPFRMTVFGTIGQLAGAGKGNDITVNASVNPDQLFAAQPAAISPSGAAAPLAPLSPGMEPALSAALHLLEDTLHIREFRLFLGENNGALVTGQIRNLFQPKQMEKQLAFQTTPVLDLGQSQQALQRDATHKASGQIQGNGTWHTGPGYSNLQGMLAFSQVASEFLQLRNLTGNIVLEGPRAVFNFGNIQIPGLDAGLSAMIQNVQVHPLPVSDFRLAGRQFILEAVLDWVDTVLNNRMAQLGATPGPAMAPAGPGMLPFEIVNGTVALGEVIVNNITMENFSADVRVAADQSFALNNFKTELAEGHIRGDFIMAPHRNNRVAANVRFENIEASALSHMFSEEPSQVFGDISGTLDIETEGKTREAQLSNLNGKGQIRVDNGRLPQVARLENLMLATSGIAGNLLSGGLPNFSFNHLNWQNLANLALQYRTDYFATMTGSFIVTNGVLHTEDLLVDGQNLDFSVQGKLRLIDNVADLHVDAQMDRNAGGALGSISNAFPAGKLFGWTAPLRIFLGVTGLEHRKGMRRVLAVVGFGTGGYQLYDIFRDGFKLNLPTITRLTTAISSLQLLKYLPPVRHLIDRIPGIGYVPGIGPLTSKGIAFEADVIGPLTDPGSVKNIRWGGGISPKKTEKIAQKAS